MFWLAYIFFLIGMVCVVLWALVNSDALVVSFKRWRQSMGGVPIWLKDPTNPQTFPESVQREIAAHNVALEQMAADQCTLLARYGLPLPKRATNFSFLACNNTQKATLDNPYVFDFAVTYPTYIIPRFVLLPIFRNAYFLFHGTETKLDHLEQDLINRGLASVLDTYQSAWVSRDPYLWFRDTKKAAPSTSPISTEDRPSREFIASLPERLKRFVSLNPAYREILTTPPLFHSQCFPKNIIPFLDHQSSPETILGLGASHTHTLSVSYYDLAAPEATFQVESNKLSSSFYLCEAPKDYVTLPEAVRDKHVYVVGKSGSGKSTLILNMARQDIEHGQGVCVIDPHGDLTEDLLTYIPESRIQDTIYINAADTRHPVNINVMSAESDDEITLLADDLLVTFRRLSERGCAYNCASSGPMASSQ